MGLFKPAWRNPSVLFIAAFLILSLTGCGGGIKIAYEGAAILPDQEYLAGTGFKNAGEVYGLCEEALTIRDEKPYTITYINGNDDTNTTETLYGPAAILVRDKKQKNAAFISTDQMETAEAFKDANTLISIDYYGEPGMQAVQRVYYWHRTASGLVYAKRQEFHADDDLDWVVKNALSLIADEAYVSGTGAPHYTRLWDALDIGNSFQALMELAGGEYLRNDNRTYENGDFFRDLGYSEEDCYAVIRNRRVSENGKPNSIKQPGIDFSDLDIAILEDHILRGSGNPNAFFVILHEDEWAISGYYGNGKDTPAYTVFTVAQAVRISDLSTVGLISWNAAPPSSVTSDTDSSTYITIQSWGYTSSMDVPNRMFGNGSV